jgi:hypothetical protein
MSINMYFSFLHMLVFLRNNLKSFESMNDLFEIKQVQLKIINLD